MSKMPRQECTAEFKDLPVTRVRSGLGLVAVARNLELIEQTLRNRVTAARARKLDLPGIHAIAPEQVGLSRARTENARLRMENKIPIEVTAYFTTDEGWLCLGVVSEFFNREIVGWSIKPRMSADIGVDALTTATFRRRSACFFAPIPAASARAVCSGTSGMSLA